MAVQRDQPTSGFGNAGMSNGGKHDGQLYGDDQLATQVVVEPIVKIFRMTVTATGMTSFDYECTGLNE